MSYLDELFSVTGKTALVTGAATGIGRMAATALVTRRRDRADRLAQGRRLRARRRRDQRARRPGTAEGFAGDVCTEAGVLALVGGGQGAHDAARHPGQQCRRLLGRALRDLPLQGLGQGAGRQRHRPVPPDPRADRRCWKRRASADDPSRIINLGSVMGTQPLADDAYSYTASKAAVHHLTRTLAIEFASRHITVNAFAPGPFRSRMTAFATASDEQARACRLARAARPHRRAGRHCRRHALSVRPRRRATSPAPSCRSTAASRSSTA